jgi:hypothetical protein
MARHRTTRRTDDPFDGANQGDDRVKGLVAFWPIGACKAAKKKRKSAAPRKLSGRKSQVKKKKS